MAPSQATVPDPSAALGEGRQEGAAPSTTDGSHPEPGLQREPRQALGSAGGVSPWLDFGKMRQGSVSSWCKPTHVYPLEQLAAYPSTHLVGKALLKQLSLCE